MRKRVLVIENELLCIYFLHSYSNHNNNFLYRKNYKSAKIYFFILRHLPPQKTSQVSGGIPGHILGAITHYFPNQIPRFAPGQISVWMSTKTQTVTGNSLNKPLVLTRNRQKGTIKSKWWPYWKWIAIGCWIARRVLWQVVLKLWGHSSDRLKFRQGYVHSIPETHTALITSVLIFAHVLSQDSNYLETRVLAIPCCSNWNLRSRKPCLKHATWRNHFTHVESSTQPFGEGAEWSPLKNIVEYAPNREFIRPQAAC